MKCYQGHDAHPIQLSVGAAWNASRGGVARAWGRAAQRRACTQRGRDGAHRTETTSQAFTAANPALYLFCSDGCALLLFLDHSGGEKYKGVGGWGGGGKLMKRSHTYSSYIQHACAFMIVLQQFVKYHEIIAANLCYRCYCVLLPLKLWYLISLLIASSCSCSIKASVCASAWPPGDSKSTELNIVSRSSSRSEASMSLSNAWATFARTLACCTRSHSCSFRVCTWVDRHTHTQKGKCEWMADRRRALTGQYWTLIHHSDV